MGTNVEAKEEEAFEEALAPIVNKLIDKNYETSKDKIASQMAPLIGSAIKEQIKNQKDDVVDALYPVMGNMISKYVTQSLEDMLNKINEQIQNGLSVATLKRKIKAKIKGVSETELLLSEVTSSHIQAALLIHKESGIVLAHIETQEQQLNEPEMLASMMTAIRSFVNDWIQQNNDFQELGEIDYGGNKIIIEASGYSYLAVIVHGGAYKNTYDAIRECLASIVSKYGDTIKNFQGDTTSLDIEALQKEMLPLIQLQKDDTNEEEQTKKKLHPLVFIIPFVFLGGFAYYSYVHYKQQQNQHAAQISLEHNPQLALYHLNTQLHGNTLTLQGVVPFTYYKQLAQQILKEKFPNYTIENNITVLEAQYDPIQTNAHIAYLIQGLNTQAGVALEYHYDQNQTLTLLGNVWDNTRKQRVLKTLKTLQGVTNIVDNVSIHPPALHQTIYFQKNQTKLSQEAQKKLISFIKKLQLLDDNIPLRVVVYSDMLGSYKKNILLSKQRAQNIKNFLQHAAQLHNPLTIERKMMPPPQIDSKKDPSKARCATISIQKKGE